MHFHVFIHSLLLDLIHRARQVIEFIDERSTFVLDHQCVGQVNKDLCGELPSCRTNHPGPLCQITVVPDKSSSNFVSDHNCAGQVTELVDKQYIYVLDHLISIGLKCVLTYTPHASHI